VNSTYDKNTGEWNIFKRDYHQLVADIDKSEAKKAA
jgi:hypothetical protein